MSGLPDPNLAQMVQELGIPWLIIHATDPNEAWRTAARAELAARLNRLMYAPIRAQLLTHQHPHVRAVVTEILELPDSPVIRIEADPQDEEPPPDSPAGPFLSG